MAVRILYYRSRRRRLFHITTIIKLVAATLIFRTGNSNQWTPYERCWRNVL